MPGASLDWQNADPSAALLLTQVGAGPNLVPRLRRSTILAIRLPALPGWADVWLPALRAWVRFEIYFRVPTQPFRAGLTFGSRPYGPRSDSRSIFEFPHRLFRAGLMFGTGPPGLALHVTAGNRTFESVTLWLERLRLLRLRVGRVGRRLGLRRWLRRQRRNGRRQQVALPG
jgi:hypothetical protein